MPWHLMLMAVDAALEHEADAARVGEARAEEVQQRGRDRRKQPARLDPRAERARAEVVAFRVKDARDALQDAAHGTACAEVT